MIQVNCWVAKSQEKCKEIEKGGWCLWDVEKFETPDRQSFSSRRNEDILDINDINKKI